ncbi:ABC transporter permease [Microlunatus endophyticus]|uniref:ABC transporter permease n=1 Tax=Microlunatus endophyticus TaxID=1716077 RepID=A0A917SDT0_9ACTN|nr:ABC transporter permease subunit [Microlunatus endophyticus]GGL73201.1 ABC transporter permease [Microlunatus endophyticus]
MTTVTATKKTTGTDLTGARLTFPHLMLSEWIKMRSIRSTVWCYLVIFVLNIAISVLASLGVNPTGQHLTGDAANSAVVQFNTANVTITGLVAAVLGVLIISGEYGTGMIRSTFAADPRRYGAVGAKALVLAVTTFVISGVSAGIGVLGSGPIMSSNNVDVNLGDADVLKPLLGAELYVAMITLLAFGIGLLIRVSAGGVAIAVGLLFVVPILLQVIAALTHQNWITNITQFLPSQAGGQLYAYQAGTASGGDNGIISLNAWQGFAVLAAEVVAVGAVAVILLKRRDA